MFVKEESSLLSGYQAFERSKIKDIVRLLSKCGAYDDKHAVPVNKLAELLGVKAEFIMSPLEELAGKDFIEIQQHNTDDAQSLESFSVTLTQFGAKAVEIL